MRMRQYEEEEARKRWMARERGFSIQTQTIIPPLQFASMSTVGDSSLRDSFRSASFLSEGSLSAPSRLSRAPPGTVRNESHKRPAHK